MADLADGILGDFELARGEGIALLNQASFSTAYGALAFADALVLLDALDAAGALDLEAFGANRSVLHPRVGEVRPYPGLQRTLVRLRGAARRERGGGPCAAGSAQLPDARARRTVLRATPSASSGRSSRSSSTPPSRTRSSLVDEEQVISVGNFEIQPFATALDFARLALAPVITSAAERAVKLLQAPLTGLTEGLGARPAMAESALSEFGIAAQAFAAEARLLAQPVSFENVSTTQAEGLEDRMTMAPLAARRLEAMVELGARVVSIELLLAAQACDLRGARLGAGTDALRVEGARVRPVPRRGRHPPRPRAARRRDPLGEALRADDGRDRRPPASLASRPSSTRSRERRDDAAPRREHARPAAKARTRSISTTTCSRRRLALLDAAGIDIAVVSLQPTLGLEALAADERERLERIWEDGVLELAAAVARPDRPSRREPAAGRDSPASRSAPTRSTTSTRWRPCSTRCAAPASSSSIRSRVVPYPVRPPGGPRSSTTRRRCSAPTSRGSRVGRAAGPTSAIVFAILAGGAPIQLERLASRGVDVRTVLYPNVFFDTSSYGRRALEVCVETFGVEQLVHGSDAPVIDPGVTLRAIRGFGESVEKLVTVDNPNRLLT